MANEEMDFNDERGKIFVGGLSWETTQEHLQSYFSRFGEVVDSVVMKNNETGRSRGFGFVTFGDPNNVDNVLQNGPHELDGRTIDPKPCNPRYMAKPQKGGGYPKVFLGGLPANVTETDLRGFFERYGKVMEVVIMYDQERKKSRGFGFLSFEDDLSVERVCTKHYINLHGKQVEVKKAEPRDGGYSNRGDRVPRHMGHSNGTGHHMSQGPPGGMHGYQQQGWGGPPQQNYGGYNYGAPSAPPSYQGWGAPPQPPPQQQQWGPPYTPGPQQSQPYGGGYSGGYDMYNQGGGQSATSGANWNYNSWPPSSAPGPADAAMPPADPSAAAPTTGGEYTSYGSGGYGSFGNYAHDQNSSYGPIRTTYDNKKQGVAQPPYQPPHRAPKYNA